MNLLIFTKVIAMANSINGRKYLVNHHHVKCLLLQLLQLLQHHPYIDELEILSNRYLAPLNNGNVRTFNRL